MQSRTSELSSSLTEANDSEHSDARETCDDPSLSVRTKNNWKVRIKNKVFWIALITAAPLGFLLYIDPSSVQGDGCIDITHFSSYGFDDICDISVPIVIKEVNSWVPAGFRRKKDTENANF